MNRVDRRLIERAPLGCHLRKERLNFYLSSLWIEVLLYDGLDVLEEELRHGEQPARDPDDGALAEVLRTHDWLY